jgi:predicted glycosyltransferase involved in capsule biosynthesis
MRDLTLILPYYRNQGMLIEQQRVWRAYPEEIKRHFHAIVVDDGSPKYAARQVVQPTGIASFRLYRCDVDVRWNWLFCRNLGVSQASTVWVLLTDVDHLLPSDTLRNLLTMELDSNRVYRLSRVDAPDLTPYKPHPNTWLMTRQMYDAIGGYDERFSGYYGTDGEFRDRVQATAMSVEMLSHPLIRVPRDVIPDASTTHYGRKEEQDREGVHRIRAERGKLKNWRPLRLTFPWTHEATILRPAEVEAC